MGKFLGAIITTIAGVALMFVPGGQALGASLIASGLGQFIVTLLTPGAPKPETTTTAIKTSRPPRVSGYGRSRMFGAYVLYEAVPAAAAAGWVGGGGDVAVDVYAVHEGKIDGIETYYLGDETVTLSGNVVNEGSDGRYRDGAVRLYTTDGSSPGAGFPALESLLPGIWTSSHRGDGVAAIALTARGVKAKTFQETYPSSTVPTPSIVARWQRCPDPAATDPLDESGWTWTENPVRQLLHYKMVREGPQPAIDEDDPAYPAQLAALRLQWWSRKIAPALQYWVDAAAVCDEAVALKAGGTEPRYRSLVSHKHTDKHEGVIANFIATFDGWICPRNDGALVVYAGKYYAPDPVDDLIGPDQIVSYTWNGGAVDDDIAINEIVCSYNSAEHDYNSVECDAWRDETDITARGQILSDAQEIAVPSNGQSRRLAKRKIQKMLAADRGSVTTNLAGRHARGKRYIWLTIAEAGTTFYDGPAEIVKMSRALQGGVTFEWVAADPNVDAWNPASEEGDPAAIGNRVAPAALVAPSITGNAVTFDSTGTRLQLIVESPDRDDLTWFVHWRVVGAGIWGPDEQSTDTDSGTAVSLVTGYVPADATIEAQVAYQTGDGRFSEWSAVVSTDTDTSSLAPSPAASLSVEGAEGVATAQWRNPTTGNFGYVKLYRSGTAVFGDAVQVGADIPGALGEVMQYSDPTGVGEFFYWVRAYSVNDVPAAATGPASTVVPYSAGTNPVLSPESFDSSDWVKDAGGGGSAPVVTADYGTDPMGGATADRAQFTRSGSGFSRLSQAVAVSASVNYRFGVWIKGAAGASIALRIDTTNGSTLTLDGAWQHVTLDAVAGSATMACELILWDAISGAPSAADVQLWGAELHPV